MKKLFSKIAVWKVILFVEFIALIIAAAMVITPGKLPSSKGLVYQFFDNPTFIESIFINFLFTNIVLAIIAAILLILVNRDSKKSKPDGN